jgi:hypothetical protein
VASALDDIGRVRKSNPDMIANGPLYLSAFSPSVLPGV